MFKQFSSVARCRAVWNDTLAENHLNIKNSWTSHLWEDKLFLVIIDELEFSIIFVPHI